MQINISSAIQTFEKGSGDSLQLSEKGWDLLAEEVSFPVAILNEKDIVNNAKWMQKFSEQANVQLAPHGKTSMAPDLFKLQLESGCWGMSLATMPQVVNAYQHGIKRIILANQLIGKYHCQQLVELLNDETFEFYCFVDSIENAQYLADFFSQTNVSLNILLEIGVPGGRCGWRSISDLEKLIQVIAEQPSLNIAGISFYEGVIHGRNAEEKICEFIQQVKVLFNDLSAKGTFDTQDIIITGAGSAWYDVVAKTLTNEAEALNFIPVIRPGCYLIHDTGIYQDAQDIVMQRSQIACDVGGDLASSLTVWAYVYSVPEPGLAIIGLGKRDVAFDAGLPTPELHYRPGNPNPTNVNDLMKKNSPWVVTNIMDQHCMMEIGQEDDLKPGDIISFSTSHPCLTLDKWRKVGIVNDDYVVTKQVATFF